MGSFFQPRPKAWESRHARISALIGPFTLYQTATESNLREPAWDNWERSLKDRRKCLRKPRPPAWALRTSPSGSRTWIKIAHFQNWRVGLNPCREICFSVSRSFRLNQFLPIVIHRIANHRMDVVGAALGRVLDENGRALDAEVSDAPLGRRPTPREISVSQVGLDLGHFRCCRFVLRNVDPLAYQFQ